MMSGCHSRLKKRMVRFWSLLNDIFPCLGTNESVEIRGLSSGEWFSVTIFLSDMTSFSFTFLSFPRYLELLGDRILQSYDGLSD
jgi:hypothetical protein